MKTKRVFAVLVILVLLAGLSAACGSDKDPELIKAAATGFLEGIKNADPDEIRKYSTDGVVNDEDLGIFDPVKVEEGIYGNIGIEKEMLDAPLQEQVSALCETLAKNFLKDYTLGEEITEENGIMKMEADVTYGYDVNEILTGQEMNEKLGGSMAAYQTENGDALLALYMSEGEEAGQKKVINDLLPQIVTAVQTEIEQASPAPQKMTLTLQKIEGEWKVTEAWHN